MEQCRMMPFLSMMYVARQATPSSSLRQPQERAMVLLRSERRGMLIFPSPPSFRSLRQYSMWANLESTEQARSMAPFFSNSMRMLSKAMISVGQTKVKSRGQKKRTTYLPIKSSRLMLTKSLLYQAGAEKSGACFLISDISKCIQIGEIRIQIKFQKYNKLKIYISQLYLTYPPRLPRLLVVVPVLQPLVEVPLDLLLPPEHALPVPQLHRRLVLLVTRTRPTAHPRLPQLVLRPQIVVEQEAHCVPAADGQQTVLQEADLLGGGLGSQPVLFGFFEVLQFLFLFQLFGWSGVLVFMFVFFEDLVEFLLLASLVDGAEGGALGGFMGGLVGVGGLLDEGVHSPTEVDLGPQLICVSQRRTLEAGHLLPPVLVRVCLFEHQPSHYLSRLLICMQFQLQNQLSHKSPFSIILPSPPQQPLQPPQLPLLLPVQHLHPLQLPAQARQSTTPLLPPELDHLPFVPVPFLELLDVLVREQIRCGEGVGLVVGGVAGAAKAVVHGVAIWNIYFKKGINLILFQNSYLP